MKFTHYSHLPTTGDGDLVLFRDAAITYAACRRQGGVLLLESSESARDLLEWLGIDGERSGPAEGIAYLDPARQSPEGLEIRSLPAWTRQTLSLESFRQQGYVAEAMFAALIRSSYGPDRLDFFPTRSELGFYFDDSLLLSGPARWDQEYLTLCQAFFMEELMPAELLEKSFALLPAPRRHGLAQASRRWDPELRGVTFLVASELVSLLPLARLLEGLLALDAPVGGLKELVQGVETWERDSWSAAWQAQPEERRQRLAAALCPEFTEQAEPILYAAGPELLLWRAGAVTEALR